MIRTYNALLWPLRGIAGLWAALSGLGPERRANWDERLARRLPSPPAGGIWLHGASVGEARIATGLAHELRRVEAGIPLSVSAVTATGRRQLPAPPVVDAAFLAPLDFPGAVRRVLGAVRPGLLALVETELWPNLLHQSRQAAVPVTIINGRLSAARMVRYRRWSRLYRPLLSGLARVGAQSAADAARFVELGVGEDAIEVTGNVKYDLPLPDVDVHGLRTRLGLSAERPVWVAGSTREGEEEQILDAFRRLRAEHPELYLVLAPRHPPRSDSVERLVRAAGLDAVRLSQVAAAATERPDVLLVDSVGELTRLYRLASVAFVGGTLVPVGGHNLLEPAAMGVPVLFGGHTENVREMADALLHAGGGMQIASAGELAQVVGRLLSDRSERERMGDSAKEFLEANRGALARSVELILDVMRGTSVEVA